MSNQIEKLETVVVVESSRERLIHRFPYIRTKNHTDIFIDNRLVLSTTSIDVKVKEVLEVMKKHFPGRVGFVSGQQHEISPYYIRLTIRGAKKDLWVYTKGKDQCAVEVTDFDSDIDNHYDSVAWVKAALEGAGFIISEAVCEITKKTRC